MVEPFRSDPVEHLSMFVGTIPSFVRHREDSPWLKTILQKMRSAPLRRGLQAEPTKGSRLVGDLLALAKVLAGTYETTLMLAAVRPGTLVNRQPRYFSNIALKPVLPCARS
jgi:hypothetical protein